MRIVGLEPDALERFPHQFSGGQRQRICIARALAMQPKVLIADEAVSALDVSVQAQVLELLDDVRQRFDLAMLFITHDLRVAAQICDRIMVMQRGVVVEQGRTAEVYAHPGTSTRARCWPPRRAGRSRSRGSERTRPLESEGRAKRPPCCRVRRHATIGFTRRCGRHLPSGSSDRCGNTQFRLMEPLPSKLTVSAITWVQPVNEVCALPDQVRCDAGG